MLVYQSRTHAKTIQLINEIVNHVNDLKGSKKAGIEYLTIPKNGMTEYHLGYIIEKLEQNGNKIEMSQGMNTFNLCISWNNDRLQEIKFLWELEGNSNIGGWSTHVRHEDIGWLIRKVEELQREINKGNI